MDVGKAAVDDTEALIAKAEAGLAEMASSGAMARDPYRIALTVLVAVVRALSAARHPLTVAERENLKGELVLAVGQGAQTAIGREARFLGRRMEWRLATIIGLAVGGAFLLGAGSAVAVVTGYQGNTDATLQRFLAAVPACITSPPVVKR